MEKRIFISYSSKDVSIANQMVEYLEANGLQCWIAPRNITSGHDYTDMINDAINDCLALVLIMSVHSVKSQWVKKELSTAVSYNKTIIPFKITEVNLTGGLQFMLNNVQWIEATSNSTQMFPQVIKGLGVEGLTNVTPAVEPPSGGKKRLWIILAAVVAVAILAGVMMFSTGDKTEPESEPPAVKTDTVVIEKIVDTMTVESSSKSTSDIKKSTDNKRDEVAKTKDKDKKNAKTEAATSVRPIEETKNEPRQEVSTVSAREEEVHTPKTVVMPEELPSVTTDPISQPTKSTSSPKFRKATDLWGQKKYKEALPLFLELKKADPTNTKLDRYISDCRSHL